MLDSSIPQSESDTADMFEHLSVHTLSDDKSRRDVFADIDIRQDSARRIIHLHAKVDTGAQANTIPLPFTAACIQHTSMQMACHGLVI